MIVIIIICIVLSALFSSSETAFASVNKIRLKSTHIWLDFHIFAHAFKGIITMQKRYISIRKAQPSQTLCKIHFPFFRE